MPAAAARTFSDQIRDAIRECGMPVAQLGRLADVDHGVIHRFLADDRGLTTATLDKLADALGIRVVGGRATPRNRKARTRAETPSKN